MRQGTVKYRRFGNTGIQVSAVNHRVYGLRGYAKRAYQWVKPESRPDRCIKCAKCEDRCPRKIEVRRQLKEVAKELG